MMGNKKITIAFVLLVGVLGFGGSVHAAEPIINSLSSTNISTGETLIVSGSNLIDQDTTNWTFSESQGSFEDTLGWQEYIPGFPCNYWIRDGWIYWSTTCEPDNPNANDPYWDSAIQLIGNQSYRQHWHLNGSNWYGCDGTFGGKICPGRVTRYVPTEVFYDEAYYRMYIRYSNDFKWPNNYWKIYYATNQIATIDPTPNTCSYNKGPRYYGFAGSHGRLSGDIGHETDIERWYCLEWYWKIIAPDDPDDDRLAVKFWVDGVKIIDEVGYEAYYDPGFHANAGMELGTNCATFSLNQSPVDQYVWLDGFAMSNNSRIYPATIVEIGDGPDYNTSVKVKQELLHISDDHIEFQADLTGLGSGPYYLWVINNRQERSDACVLNSGVSGTIFFQEFFEDTGFGSRGWYDNTGLQLSTAEHIAGSNSSVEFHFNLGGTTPTSGGGIRHKFTDTGEVYVGYWVKYSSNWEGSNRPYHPHEFQILTNEEDDWAGPAYTHLTAYIEQNEGEPLLAIQDGQNIDESNIGVDLTGVTEDRAVAGCNGDSDGYGDGDCYSVGDVHRNGKGWRADGVYFQDTPGQYYKSDWHFIEAYFKLNSISGGVGVPDGIIQYWYDGNLIINHTDVMMRTGLHSDMRFNQFLVAPWIGDGSPVDQTFWVDNLTVADYRVGGYYGPTYHKADLNDDGLIDMRELMAYIARWKSNDGVTKTEVEEVRDIWFNGGVY